ncbi:MAG: hypothetical protein OEM63_04940 [Gammaproteobacteria bacterium]|nr:hypothetical protein [Gammaproteobacteria bacterium]
MFLFIVAACAPEQRPVEIQFDVRLNGRVEANEEVHGFVPTTPATGLAFSLGVAESLNHADPLAANAPLGYTSDALALALRLQIHACRRRNR